MIADNAAEHGMTRRAAVRALLLLLATAPLGACGKRGRLEAPEGSDPDDSDVVLPRIRRGG